MQNCTTILGIIDMRQRGISYDDCRSRYKVGCSTIYSGSVVKTKI